MRTILAAAAALAGVASASPSCCAYSGEGAATFSGTATIDLDGKAVQLPATFAVDPETPFVAVLLGGSTPFAATAGWIIVTNATHQTMTVWQNNTAATKPVCGQAYAPVGSGFVPGFALCPGAATGSLFPTAVTSFPLGASNTVLNVYAQGAVGSAQVFTTGSDNDCAVVSVLSPGAPVGAGGAFSLAVTAGDGTTPAAALGVPPAACGF